MSKDKATFLERPTLFSRVNLFLLGHFGSNEWKTKKKEPKKMKHSNYDTF